MEGRRLPAIRSSEKPIRPWARTMGYLGDAREVKVISDRISYLKGVISLLMYVAKNLGKVT